MANFFYSDTNGTKQGPLTVQQLQALIDRGTIKPDTLLETDSGHTGLASQVPGLIFSATALPPFAQPAQAQAPPPSGNVFCTNCGNSVSEHAVACMSCGAKPVGHRNFCRHCGVALNSEQVICTKCGAGIRATGTFQSTISSALEGQKSGVTTASLILGGIGMLAWLIPLFGLPITIAGLICGIKGLSKDGGGIAKVGLVLSIIGLVLTIINAVIGALMMIG
jgi:hypothetical protein